MGTPLGAGMGEVYRATNTKLGRDVALKILPETLASSPEMVERFRREARAVAALNHPQIVTIHSVEEAGGSGPYQSPLTRGLVHAVFSEMDAAFESVQKAIDARVPMLMYLTFHPMFDALRPDPRYAQLVRQMNP